MFEVRRLLQDQQGALDRIGKHTSKLRDKYPASTVPESILGGSRTAESVFGRPESTNAGAEFAFDDIIINSKAYRRTMALAQAQIRGKAEINFGNMPDHSSDQQAQLPTDIETQSAQHAPSSSATIKRDAPLRKSITDSSSQSSASDLSSRSTLRLWKAPKYWRTFISRSTLLHESTGNWDMQSSGWASTFELKSLDVVGKPKELIMFQNIYWEILETERHFIHGLDVLQRLYVDQLLDTWPQIVHDDPRAFTERTFGGLRHVRDLHEQQLLIPLLESWESGGAWTEFNSDVFLGLLNQIEGSLLTFVQSFPDRHSSIVREAAASPKFRQYLEMMAKHRWSNRLQWDSYLKAPITRWQRYCLLLDTLAKYAISGELQSKIENVSSQYKKLVFRCGNAVSQAQKRRDLEDLLQRLKLRRVEELSQEVLLGHEPALIRHSVWPCKIDTAWSYHHVLHLQTSIVIARLPGERERAVSERVRGTTGRSQDPHVYYWVRAVFHTGHTEARAHRNLTDLSLQPRRPRLCML